MQDAWRPDQYGQFKDERARPFFDLLEGVRPVPGGKVVDLGCGTGELTRILHEKSGAASTLGVDASPAMLERARAVTAPGLRFEQGDIAAFQGGPLDVVFSNAALHWVDDHPAQLARLAGMLAPGGQLAVQVPANEDQPSHAAARDVASQAPWRDRLAGWVRHSPVLPPERYADVLHSLGLEEPRVRLEVYGHLLESRDAIVEWVKGTTLTDYERRLSREDFAEFVTAYRTQLFREIPDRKPYFFTFKRILFWARRPR